MSFAPAKRSRCPTSRRTRAPWIPPCRRQRKLGPAIVVPLSTRTGVEGALALAWFPENAYLYEAVDAAMPASFAEQAALAIQVARARGDQQRLAVFEDRDRIGRDLHDLVIQRLFAVGLSLQGAGRRVTDPDVVARLSQAVDDLDDTIKDIRRTIFALGSLGESEDIQAEMTRLVDRAATTLKFRPALRFEGPVRSLVSPESLPTSSRFSARPCRTRAGMPRQPGSRCCWRPATRST